MKKQDVALFIADFTKTHDVFWLHDLKKEVGVKNSEEKISHDVAAICRELHKKGVLIASERRGNNIQYMVK